MLNSRPFARLWPERGFRDSRCFPLTPLFAFCTLEDQLKTIGQVKEIINKFFLKTIETKTEILIVSTTNTIKTIKKYGVL